MQALYLTIILCLAILPFIAYSQGTATPSSARPSTRRPSRPTLRPTRKPTIHIYGNGLPSTQLPQETQQIIVGVLIIAVFLGMAFELAQPEVLFFVALVFIMLAEILVIGDVLSGFSNEAMITIGALFIVIAGVEKSHIVDWLARKTFGTTGNLVLGKARFYITCFVLSIFFNNTPLVAILMPVVRDWARLRGDSASQVLMPLSYSVLSGSFISMIGTSTNLTVQGLMQADRGYSFPFFAPAPFGALLFVCLMVYMITFTTWILPHGKGGLIKSATERAETMIAEVSVTPSSKFVGKSLEAAMGALGICVSRAIKIRRPVIGDVVATEYSIPLVTSQPFLDTKHLRESFLKFTSALSRQKNALPEPDEENGHVENLRYVDIIAPTGKEEVEANDIIFVAHAQDVVEKMMKSVAGESHGLEVLETSANKLPGFGTEVVELSVSEKNPLVGIPLDDLHQAVADQYASGLISVRRKEWGTETEQRVSGFALPTNGSESHADDKTNEESHDIIVAVPQIPPPKLDFGDLLLVVTASSKIEEFSKSKDFFVVTTVGSLPKPISWYSAFPAIVFLVMLILVATDYITMVAASMTVAALFFVGGWVTAEEIPVVVDMRLLMLIATSLSFARSMTASGLAITIANTIKAANPSAFSALILVYAVTLVVTELVSNNAAAALMYPIAVAIADILKSDFKPFAMAVLIASTAGFMSPIGYQTHVMVWAPGGYTFLDFVKYGLFADILYWIGGCFLISVFLPFDGTVVLEMFAT